MAHEQAFDGLTEVAEHVEAISHLRGVGCTLACSIGIGAAAIPADDLQTWVLRHPLKTLPLSA
jgi:hypothetical protein